MVNLSQLRLPIHVLQKKINNDEVEKKKEKEGDKGEKNMDENGPLKAGHYSEVVSFKGVTDMSMAMDMEKRSVTVKGTENVIAVGEVEIVKVENKKSNYVGDGGDKNRKKGGGGSCSDSNGNSDGGDKTEGTGKMKDFIMNYKSPVKIVKEGKADNKETNQSGDGCNGHTKNNHIEGGDGQKDPCIVVFKTNLHCDLCINKIIKCVRSFGGVENVEIERVSNTLTVVGVELDPCKIRDKIQQRTKNSIELVSFKIYNEEKDSNSNGGGDDGDNNGDGGGENKKKGDGGDSDGNDHDGDKDEGVGGGKMKGFKMGNIGQPDFGYNCRYHAGNENGYPVGQLHVPPMYCRENPNDFSIMRSVMLV